MIAALALYWPGIFILTHIPIARIPKWVLKTSLTDKTAHCMAYMALVFLVWFTISPYKKVNWRKATVWWVLLVVVWYGVIDEWLQGMVGRNADVNDFIADLFGCMLSLILLTIFNFWPACLILTGGTIFILTNFMQTAVNKHLPVSDTVFYTLAYAFYSLVWIRYMRSLIPVSPPQKKWLIGALFLPIISLTAVELFSAVVGNGVSLTRQCAGLAGIFGMVLIYYAVEVIRYVTAKKTIENLESLT